MLRIYVNSLVFCKTDAGLSRDRCLFNCKGIVSSDSQAQELFSKIELREKSDKGESRKGSKGVSEAEKANCFCRGEKTWGTNPWVRSLAGIHCRFIKLDTVC